MTAKDESTITFDANHEMAGKELNFRIELVEVGNEKMKKAGKGVRACVVILRYPKIFCRKIQITLLTNKRISVSILAYTAQEV